MTRHAAGGASVPPARRVYRTSRALAALALIFATVALWAAPAAAQNAVPTAPTITSLTEPEVGKLRVEWSAVTATPAVSDYEVSYNATRDSRDTTRGATRIMTGSAGIRSFTISGSLAVGTTYYIYVRAINSEGNGAWSQLAQVVIHGPLSLPSPPTRTVTTTTEATATFTVNPQTATCTDDSARASLTTSGTSRTVTITGTVGSGDHAVTVTCVTSGQNTASFQFVAHFANPLLDGTGAGNGMADEVNHDSPVDAVDVIRDYGLENAPIIIGVIGAIFLVALTFYLVRRGLMKARGAMRL